MSEEAQVIQPVPRRQALCGIIALGVLGPAALAACSNNQDFGQPSSGSSAPGNTGSSPSAGGGSALAKTSQVPVGGGVVVTGSDGKKIVIAQPTAGQFKAYDATCTHQGTIVGAPQNGTMTCPNHGSQFSAADGSATKGPATAPLKAVNVTVSGDSIVLA
jgi:Rieske Fe-S protein